MDKYFHPWDYWSVITYLIMLGSNMIRVGKRNPLRTYIGLVFNVTLGMYNLAHILSNKRHQTQILWDLRANRQQQQHSLVPTD